MNEEKNQLPVDEAPQTPEGAEQSITPEEDTPTTAAQAQEAPANEEAPQEAQEAPANEEVPQEEQEAPTNEEAPQETQAPCEPKVIYRWDYGAQKRYDDEVRRKRERKKSGFAFFGIVSCAFLIVIGLLIGVLAFRDSFSFSKSQGADTVAIAEKLLPATVLITATEGTTGSVGSGFFVRQDGMIATNYHVVEGADTIKVKLYGSNEKKEATVVGYNAACDIAVLKIAGSGYPVVTFGDSDALRVGDEAIAIGNPAGTDAEWTVTKGIISSTNRKLLITATTEIRELKMIQTDAAVNPGNSGGLLCNDRGEVIGIVARKQIYRSLGTESGETVTVFDEGIGYVIPGNGAKAIIQGIFRLQDVDPVAAGLMRVRPKIGITVISIKKGEKLADEQIMEAPQDGILVATVGTNAANGLLEVGDIIVAFDGVAVTESDALIEMLYSYKQGDKVKVKVIKNGEYYPSEIELTLGIFGS